MLGRRKAFWRTVKLVCFKTAVIAGEISRPVSLADALAFRRAVVWCAFIPLALVTAASYIAGFELYERPWYPGDAFGSIAMWVGLPVGWAGLWLFLYFLFGAQSYLYHPKRLTVRQQNRAVALSYYACAPWAYLFIVPIIALVFGGFAWLTDGPTRPPVLLIAIMCLVTFVPILLWIVLAWFVPQRMLHKTTQCGRGKLALHGLVIRPFGFVLLFLLTVGLINFAYWGLVLIVISLR